jgi:hypothetical protein
MLEGLKFQLSPAVSQLSPSCLQASITLSAKELRKREAELLYEAMAGCECWTDDWNLELLVLVHFVELSWVRTVPSAL